MSNTSNTSITDLIAQVTAFTALVGTNSAQSLVLGGRGAAGLPWAVMSAFGSMSVVKACLTAATPGWLRGMLAFRDASIDAVIGRSLATSRLTRNAGERPLGISSRDNGKTQEVVFAFDEVTTDALASCPTASAVAPAEPQILTKDPHWKLRRSNSAKFGLICTALSTIKVAESVALWKLGSQTLALLTSASWLFFTTSSLLLAMLYDWSPEPAKAIAYVDVVSGELPATQVPPGDKKILLGVPPSPHDSLAWRLTWFVGGIIHAATSAASYVLLTNANGLTVYAWLGSQGLWLLCRLGFNYVSTSVSEARFTLEPLHRRETKSLTSEVRDQLLHLALAVTKYQTQLHARGPYCYLEDVSSVEDLNSILTKFPSHISHVHLSGDRSETHQICIREVIGDTLLSSFTWLYAQSDKLGNMDLYDSCILVVSWKSQEYLIPACRVLSGPPHNPDVESSNEARFVSKGGGNDIRTATWYYWIPVEGSVWLQLRSERLQMKNVTKETAVMTGVEMDKQLQRGHLMISMSSTADIELAIQKSAAALAELRRLVY